MAIFHSYVSLPEGIHLNPKKKTVFLQWHLWASPRVPHPRPPLRWAQWWRAKRTLDKYWVSTGQWIINLKFYRGIFFIGNCYVDWFMLTYIIIFRLGNKGTVYIFIIQLNNDDCYNMGFLKLGALQNHGFNTKMVLILDDLGVPPVQETSGWQNNWWVVQPWLHLTIMFSQSIQHVVKIFFCYYIIFTYFGVMIINRSQHWSQCKLSIHSVSWNVCWLRMILQYEYDIVKVCSWAITSCAEHTICIDWAMHIAVFYKL